VAKRALNLAWFYYFSKFIDLFDSFFFIARKKFGHLSLLHVVHHSTLPMLCW
jgi:elongation of very long chain fatty acids protein 7